MNDKTLGACQCHEKHAPTYWKGVVREYKDALEKAESRPLTPGAITDEMVKRALGANGQPETSVDSSSGRRMRHILTAALTDPPARPEWADLGEALDRLWPHGTDGIAREDIARRLHTEAGVRVVGENEENR